MSDVTSDRTITANFVNSPPTATPQSVTVSQNGSVGITLSGTDLESGSLTYAVASGPSNGSLSGVAPTLTYAPTAGYVGGDSFTFTVSDGTNTSPPATVSITVTALTPPTGVVVSGTGSGSQGTVSWNAVSATRTLRGTRCTGVRPSADRTRTAWTRVLRPPRRSARSQRGRCTRW